MTYEHPGPDAGRTSDILMPASRPDGDPAPAKTRRSLGWTAAIVVVLLAGGLAVVHDHGATRDDGAIAGANTANANAGPLQGVGAPWGAPATATPTSAPHR